MAPVASQLMEEITAHAQSDSLEDAREICADGTYFPNNLRIFVETEGLKMTYKVETCRHLKHDHVTAYILMRLYSSAEEINN